jgi:deoxyribose-phosphate aldolase
MGATEPEIKAQETALAVSRGADEIDMVINVGLALEGKWQEVENEIALVKKAAGRATLKVIIETSFLTAEQIVSACNCCTAAGAEFVKTSTGFFGAGASVENVALMKKTVGTKAQVKASGGIRDLETALAMIAAGADRLGVSAGVKIIEEARKND